MTYKFEDFAKITKRQALELVKEGRTVLCLFDNETESIAQTIEDIERHAEYGEFGIEIEAGYYEGL